MRHLIVIHGLILHVNRGLLARATGPFSSHGSFCLVEVNDRATRRVAQSVRRNVVTLLHDSTRITSRGFYTANFEELGHLEQIPYAYVIWRVQLQSGDVL